MDIRCLMKYRITPIISFSWKFNCILNQKYREKKSPSEKIFF
jgi:hypothetical protein